jgi:hypothetical protein
VVRYLSSKVVVEVQERSGQLAKTARATVTHVYVTKAQDIMERKAVREKKLREEIEERNQKYIARKQKQSQDYLRLKAADVDAIQQLQERINHKAQREKPKLTPDSTSFWSEMRKLNEAVQRENTQRLARINDHKRQRVLASQSTQALLQTQQRVTSILHDCNLRAKSIHNHQAHDATNALLAQLAKTDTSTPERRQQVVQSLQTLNNYLGLGIKLPVGPGSMRHQKPNGSHSPPQSP